MNICKIEGCKKRVFGHGLCNTHYQRKRRGRPIEGKSQVEKTHEERFLESFEKTETCWLWTSYTTNSGYGTISVDGVPMGAHRYSYEKFKGPIPEGLLVLHTCDVRKCVNPDHLWLGTHKQNTQDMLSKNRGRYKNVRITNVSRVLLGNLSCLLIERRKELWFMFSIINFKAPVLVKFPIYLKFAEIAGLLFSTADNPLIRGKQTRKLLMG